MRPLFRFVSPGTTPRHKAETFRRTQPRLEILEDRLTLSAYYVSPAGSDTNNGLSPNTAWKSLAKVNHSVFLPGDSILLQGGATFSGTLRFNSTSSGTPTAPITVSSYGTGQATVAAGGGTGLFALDTAGFNISNLNFVGGSGNNKNGILFRNDFSSNVRLHHVYLDSVTVSGFGGDGVEFAGISGQSGYSDVHITNVIAQGNGNNGIYVYGQTPSASNDTVYVGHCQAYNDGASGIEIGDTSGGTIERCEAHDNGLPIISSVGIWTYDSTAITIQYNESYHNRSPTNSDGDGFDLDGGVTNSFVQYNYAHDNDGAGYLLGEYPGSGPTTGNTIRFNISQNDGVLNNYAGIYVYNYDQPTNKVTNNSIYNNTVYNAVGGADVFLSGNLAGATNVFANNIFQTASGVPLVRNPSGTGASFTGNAYWSSGGPFLIRWGGVTYTSLRAFQSGGQEMLNGQPTGSSVNPQLQNPGGGGTIGNPDQLATLTAYQLLPTSPLLGTGLNL